MKKQLFTLIAILMAGMTFAQSGFNYKALITDNGSVLNNQAVTFRFSLLQNGTANVYQETQNATTDANGIVSLNVGEGTVLSGNFSTINWENTYFLKVEIDTGNGYQDFGTSELKYVPYAKYAESAGNTFSGNFNDLSNVPTGLSDGDDVNDADHNPTNEIQTLSVSGNQLTISNGNTVTLPTGSGGDQWGSQVVQSNSSLNGDGTSANPLGVNTNSSAFNGWDKNASDDVQELNDLSDAIYGNFNLFLGFASGNNSIAGMYNVGVGESSLAQIDDGRFNTAIGKSALHNLQDGYFNTTVGANSLDAVTGSNNTAIGYGAGQNVNGSGNIFIGKNAGKNTTGNNMLIIANSDTSTPLIYGDLASSELAVNGSLAVKDGTQGAGKIFTSDANGKGSWQDVSAWDTDASDDFSGDYNDLTNAPDVFRIQGTTDPATSYTDNLMHLGNMILGNEFFFSTGTNLSTLKLQRRLYDDNNSYGLVNAVSGSGSGMHYGEYIKLGGSGSGAQYGSYILVENSGDNIHYGNYTVLTGTGSGTKYGIYSKISINAGGNHYAVYGEATKDAPDVYAGYFVGDVNVNSGNLNVEDKLTAPDSGDTDMKAYIYGSITSGGTFTGNGAHSDGFTVSKTATGEYEISFNNPPGNKEYTVIVNMRYDNIGFITVKNENNYFTVRTYGTTGSAANKAFNFVVYKR